MSENLSDILNENDKLEVLEDFIKDFGGYILEEESRPAIINPVKMNSIQFVYRVLQELVKNTDAKLSYKLHEPLKAYGSISIEAPKLMFDDSKWFSRAAEFAYNVDIYPLANGDFRMTFDFNHLTIPIERGE